MSLQVKCRSSMIEILVIAAAVVAGSTPAFAEETHQFAVPAEDAAAAIRDFATQAHVQIIAAGENVAKQRLHAVSGVYSTDQGLRLLLADSGLRAKYVGDRSIALIKTLALDPGTPPQTLDRPLLAQANPAAGANASAADNSSQGTTATTEGQSQLSEVIVTAQKRSERIQDVPLSVSAIDAETLMQQHTLTVEDYLLEVPGVAFDQIGAGQDQITIRGIATGEGGAPSVGVTIDQVPFGSSLYASGCCLLPELDPLSLDRVEVLRGPQGTLYGASAMGGLINFITATPSSSSSEGRAEVDASTVAHGNEGYGVRAAYSTPLNDQFAVQVSAFNRQDPGYISDPLQGRSDVNEAHVSGGRFALDGKLLDILTVKFSALYQQTTSSGSNVIDVDLSGAPLYGPYEHERMPGTDGFEQHLQFYTLNLTADLGPVSLTSLTGFQRFYLSNPTDFTPDVPPTALYPGLENGGLSFADVIHVDRTTEEFRVASSGKTRLQYTAGLFFSRESNSVDQDIAPGTYTTGVLLPALTPAFVGNLDQVYTQYAAFANLTFNVTDQFDISAGGRYNHNNLDLHQVQSGLFIGPTPSIGAASNNETPTTYSFSTRYHFDPDEMLYARVASGFRAGGPNLGIADHPQYNPDTTVNYEVGFKSESWDHRLIVDPALYYIDWTKIRVIQTTASGLNYFTNGGTATSKGVELTVQVLPLNGLHISGNVAFDKAELTQTVDTFYGLSGDRLPFSAKWTGNITGDYLWPISGSVGGFGGFTATYTGARLMDFSSDVTVPRFEMPAFTTVDLRVGAKIDTVRATLFVRNVGDTHGFVGAVNPSGGPTGPWQAALITPRTIGISLSTDF